MPLEGCLLLLCLRGNAEHVDALQCRCATQLMHNLTVDSFAETAVLADRVKHQGLLDACLEYAMHDKNRCAFSACHIPPLRSRSRKCNIPSIVLHTCVLPHLVSSAPPVRSAAESARRSAHRGSARWHVCPLGHPLAIHITSSRVFLPGVWCLYHVQLT